MVSVANQSEESISMASIPIEYLNQTNELQITTPRSSIIMPFTSRTKQSLLRGETGGSQIGRDLLDESSQDTASWNEVVFEEDSYEQQERSSDSLLSEIETPKLDNSNSSINFSPPKKVPSPFELNLQTLSSN